MNVPDLSWTSIFAGAAAYVLVGEVWFSRTLLRVVWFRWAPDLPNHVRHDVRSYLVTSIYGLVMSWLLALVLEVWHVDHFMYGVLAGLAVLVTTKLFSVLTYAGTRNVGTAEWWIHLAYQAMTLGVMGGVFAVWR